MHHCFSTLLSWTIFRSILFDDRSLTAILLSVKLKLNKNILLIYVIQLKDSCIHKKSSVELCYKDYSLINWRVDVHIFSSYKLNKQNEQLIQCVLTHCNWFRLNEKSSVDSSRNLEKCSLIPEHSSRFWFVFVTYPFSKERSTSRKKLQLDSTRIFQSFCNVIKIKIPSCDISKMLLYINSH